MLIISISVICVPLYVRFIFCALPRTKFRSVYPCLKRLSRSRRYEVYVNLPNGKLDVADKDKYYAGAMHFFVAKPQAGQKGRRVFRYDLTDELSDAAVLGGEAKDKNQLNFSIFGIKGNTAVGFTVDKATVYSYEK